jgi:hypothetical protein
MTLGSHNMHEELNEGLHKGLDGNTQGTTKKSVDLACVKVTAYEQIQYSVCLVEPRHAASVPVPDVPTFRKPLRSHFSPAALSGKICHTTRWARR